MSKKLSDVVHGKALFFVGPDAFPQLQVPRGYFVLRGDGTV